MTFTVYPDPPNNPLSVPATTLGGAVPVTEHFAPVSSIDTMFVRFVMVGSGCAASGALAPSLFVVAGGADHEITSTNGVDVTSIDGGSAFATVYAEANDVFRLEIYKFSPTTITALRIENNDAVAREFTWTAADNDPESAQPWIEVPADVDWDVLVGSALTTQVIDVNVEVLNKGSAALTITNVAGPLAANPAFEIVSVPGAINPNECGTLGLRFIAPAGPGATNLTLDITSNDTTGTSGVLGATHNARMELAATAGSLELMMCLDASGSMGYQPDGTAAVAATDTRWAKMKDASKQFLDLTSAFGDGLGRFGVSIFPDITDAAFPPAPSPSAVDLHGPVDITETDIDDAKNSLDPHSPEPHGGATPIGHGIGHNVGTAAGSFGNFRSSQDAQDHNRRLLVLMSDGAHNSGIHPDVFYKPAEGMACGATGTAGAGESFIDKSIRVITVAYGDPSVTTFEVDHALLGTIACKSEGLALDAGIADVGGASLVKSFRDALIAGLALDPTTDPGGVLSAANSEVRREIRVLPYDTKVAFVLDWVTARAGRVTMSLLSPNCDLITLDVAAAEPGITVAEHPRYLIYTLSDEYLRNVTDPANPRHGVWTLVISAPALAGADTEAYEYAVITESRLRMRLTTGDGDHYAGDPIDLAADLRLDGLAVSDASVTMTLSAPGQYAYNWLALNPVSTREFTEAQQSIGDPEASSIGIKALALQNKGLSFNPLVGTTSRTMEEIEPGMYRTTVSNTTTPGTYTMTVVALGEIDGLPFRREQRHQVRIGVRPDPVFTWVDFTYSTVFINDEPRLTAIVTVWPQDQFGNVVFVDPEINGTVAIIAAGGKFTTGLVSNLNGSYSRTLELQPGATPLISVLVDAEPVITGAALPNPGRLAFVDRVLGFDLGAEAEPGANQHREPAAVLGDPTSLPEDFLAVGGGGSISVGADGQVLRDEVTVFVSPTATLRSYDVEVLPHDGRDQWVALGTSVGVTQSFPLRQHAPHGAVGVRIIDTSMRTRQADFTPSASPGVNVAGVGATSLAKPGELPKEPSGCLLELIASIKRLISRVLK